MSASVTLHPQQYLVAEALVSSFVEQRVSSPQPFELPRLSKFSISLDELRFNDTSARLTAPVEFELFMEDGVWNCENRELSILSFGPTVQQAVESFSEDFLALWDVIAQSPDESLTVEAQRVKRAMRKLVRAVLKR
jgi:hypothetical protein